MSTEAKKANGYREDDMSESEVWSDHLGDFLPLPRKYEDVPVEIVDPGCDGKCARYECICPESD